MISCVFSWDRSWSGNLSPEFQPKALTTDFQFVCSVALCVGSAVVWFDCLGKFGSVDGSVFFGDFCRKKVAAPQAKRRITTADSQMMVVFLFFGLGSVAAGGMNRSVSRLQCGHSNICPAISAGKAMCPLQCWQIHLASLLIIFAIRPPAHFAATLELTMLVTMCGWPQSHSSNTVPPI